MLIANKSLPKTAKTAGPAAGATMLCMKASEQRRGLKRPDPGLSG